MISKRVFQQKLLASRELLTPFAVPVVDGQRRDLCVEVAVCVQLAEFKPTFRRSSAEFPGVFAAG
jgi:hypothetical protein